jgi:hypothetical protein
MLLLKATGGFPRELMIGCALAAAMWLTRSHHLATLTHLPDASWAAIVLAGLLASPWRVPAVLLVHAGVIDYLALLGGVSNYCVTPAYPFLIPTYLTLWASGRWAAAKLDFSATGLARTAVALLLGVLSAYLVSNASFYSFSGHFGDMPLSAYAAEVAQYFPSFLESTAIYTAVAMLVLLTWHSRARLTRYGRRREHA